jgi:hypothetical protein
VLLLLLLPLAMPMPRKKEAVEARKRVLLLVEVWLEELPLTLAGMLVTPLSTMEMIELPSVLLRKLTDLLHFEELLPRREVFILEVLCLVNSSTRGCGGIPSLAALPN